MNILPIFSTILLVSITSCQQQEATPPNPAQEIYAQAAQRSIAKIRPLFESQGFVIRYKASIKQPTRELTVPEQAEPKLRQLLLAALESGECTATPCDKPQQKEKAPSPSSLVRKSNINITTRIAMAPKPAWKNASANQAVAPTSQPASPTPTQQHRFPAPATTRTS